GLAQRVDDPAEEPVTDGHRQHPAGPLDLLALLDAGEVAEDHHADLADVEVQRDTERAVGELQQLVGQRRGQALDMGDAVARVGDNADLLAGNLGRVRRDEALESATDLVGGDGQLGHRLLPLISARATRGDTESITESSTKSIVVTTWSARRGLR